MSAVPAYSSRWQNGASWVWKAWPYLGLPTLHQFTHL